MRLAESVECLHKTPSCTACATVHGLAEMTRKHVGSLRAAAVSCCHLGAAFSYEINFTYKIHLSLLVASFHTSNKQTP
jgi:hypothetical protein